jgi:hypothetical protein
MTSLVPSSVFSDLMINSFMGSAIVTATASGRVKFFVWVAAERRTSAPSLTMLSTATLVKTLFQVIAEVNLFDDWIWKVMFVSGVKVGIGVC